MNKSRERFLNSIRGLIEYWQKCESKDVAVKGVAFSIMCLLDGVSTANLYGYTVIDNETKEVVSDGGIEELHADL